MQINSATNAANKKNESIVRRWTPALILSCICSLRERFAPKDSLQGRFAGAMWWSFIGVATSNAAGLFAAAALARIMGREGYGEVGVILSTYTLFSQLGGLGLGVTAVKYTAQLRGTEPSGVGRLLGSLLTLAILSYGISALAAVFFATDLATTVLNRPALVGPLQVSGLLLLVQGIDSIQSGILAGYEEFRAIARNTMLRAAVNLPLTVLGAHFYGLYGVVGAMIASGVFTLFLNRTALNKTLSRYCVSLWYGIDWTKLKLLWDFSLPAFISATLTIISGWALNAMLVNQPDGYAQMGLFNAANQWRALGILIPGVCNSAVLSIQANLHATRNYASHHRSVTGNLIMQCLVAGLVVGILAGFAPFIMRIYGAEYEDAGGLLMLLALGWFFLTPSWILWNAAISRGKAWWGLSLNAVGTCCLMAFAVYFVQSGARGIALALLYAGMIQVGLQAIHYYASRRSDKDGQLSDACPIKAD